MIRLLFVFFTSLWGTLTARIIETNQIEEILSYINSDTWVFFDIDETLIISQLQLGRSDYYILEFNDLKQKGMEEHLAREICQSHWLAIQKQIPTRLMEASVPETIRTIQKTAALTIGLTARGPHTNQLTREQLQNLDLDFCVSSPSKISVELPIKHSYEHGIWFVSTNPKGSSVKKWLEQAHPLPKKIVFVDDRRHNLENMEESLKYLGIEYVGIHYAKISETPFNPMIAKMQAEIFPHNHCKEKVLELFKIEDLKHTIGLINK